MARKVREALGADGSGRTRHTDGPARSRVRVLRQHSVHELSVDGPRLFRHPGMAVRTDVGRVPPPTAPRSRCAWRRASSGGRCSWAAHQVRVQTRTGLVPARVGLTSWAGATPVRRQFLSKMGRCLRGAWPRLWIAGRWTVIVTHLRRVALELCVSRRSGGHIEVRET
jgi:hypothetical protein